MFLAILLLRCENYLKTEAIPCDSESVSKPILQMKVLIFILKDRT